MVAGQRSRRLLGTSAGVALGLLRSAYQAVLGGPEVPGPREDRPAP